MHDSGLAPHLFCLDTVLSERVLFSPDRPILQIGPHPLIIPLPLTGVELAEADALVVTLENRAEAVCGIGLRLVHGGDSSRVSLTGGREILDGGGRRKFFFPAESFGSYGLPDGWRDISGVDLVVRREKDAIESAVLAVAVFSVTALCRRRPAGPRLTEAGLIAVMRGTERTGLRKPGERDFFSALPPPIYPYPADSPAKVLSGRIMGQRVGFPPDWTADPLGELEWRHFLHRHHFLRPLLRAFSRTASPHYAEAALSAMESWIGGHPPPMDSDGGAGPAWETLSVAFRLREWLGVPRRYYTSMVLRSVWEHARHLLDYRGHPGNWRLLEAAALTLVGLAFPEFAEAGTWAEEGMRRLAREVAAQFYSDGMHYELSPLYHALCAEACLTVRQAAQFRGHPVPEGITTCLPRWFAALTALGRPDGTWPSINDSGGITEHYRLLLRQAGAVLSLPEARYAGGRRRFGRAPVAMGRLLPDAGLAILRSKPGPEATWALFRAGPPGAAHVHEDDLSLELYICGRPVLVDPGIGGYAPARDPEVYRRAEAHSCLLVPEGMPARAALPFRERIRPAGDGITLLRRPGCDVALGVRDRCGLAVSRAVALVAGRFVVIRDAIGGEGRTHFQVHWQFAPGIEDVGDVGDDPGFGFFPLPGALQPVRADRVAGRVSQDGRDRPALHLEYAFEAAMPAVLYWVFTPGGRGEAWTVARTGPDVIEAGPRNGPVYCLDAASWVFTVVPGRTSG
jgi:hypothetical protein